jgi:general secretion pathway protein L
MPTWLGIDIGSTSVKAALVRSQYRKLALVRVVSVDVAPGGTVIDAARAAALQVLEGQPQDTSYGGRAPKSPTADAIATAIDGSRAAIHRLVLPETAQKQLAEVLAYELGSQVPFDLETAVFDYRILDRRPDRDDGRDAGQLALVVAVARIDDVRARIDVVREALAQEPERVAVGALSLGTLVRFIPALSETDAIAIVDLGAKASEVLILERGEAVFARTVSTGTDGLPGTAPRLAREIRTTFSGYRSQGGAAPTRVYLCGGGAFVSGAEGFLSGELEVPVQLLPDPVLDLMGVAGSAHELPRYAKAISLALSLGGREGLNLRRGPLAFERGFAWVRERIPVLAGLAAVLLVSFVFSGWARIYEAHRERDALTGALGSVTKEVLGTEATSAQEAQDLLGKEAALSDEDPMPHADGFDVMTRLSEAIPTSITHDVEELDLQKGHVVIRGIAGSIPESQAIASALADYPCMSDAKIKSTTQMVGSERQKYLMEFDLKCHEDMKPAAKKKGEASPSAAASASGGK